MSHELRISLNAIIGFAELQMDDQTGLYDQVRRRRSRTD